jgi:hypothetical protein
MTVRQYGPSAQTVVPTAANKVTVKDKAGSAVTLSTAVALDGSGRVSFAVDDAVVTARDLYVTVLNDDGKTSTDRWHIGSAATAGQLRKDIAAATAGLQTAISGWGAPSGTYTVGKDTAILAALKVVASLAQHDSAATAG